MYCDVNKLVVYILVICLGELYYFYVMFIIQQKYQMLFLLFFFQCPSVVLSGCSNGSMKIGFSFPARCILRIVIILLSPHTELEDNFDFALYNFKIFIYPLTLDTDTVCKKALMSMFDIDVLIKCHLSLSVYHMY